MRKRKLIILISSGFFLAVLIGGFFIIKPFLFKEDPTAEWNTYIDEFYGYSIKYPREWFIYPDELHKIGYSTDITSFNVKEKVEEGGTRRPIIAGELSIHIAVDYKNNIPIREWLKQNPPLRGNLISEEALFINDIESIRRINDESGIMIYIPKEEKVYIIHAEPLESLMNEYKETFNLILSTIEFND